MSRLLSVLELETRRATLASLLVAAGAHLWSIEDLEAYKDKMRVQAQTRFYQFLYSFHRLLPVWMFVGLIVCGAFFVGTSWWRAYHVPMENTTSYTVLIIGIALLSAAVIFYGSLRKWETESIDKFNQFSRPLPPEAPQLMDTIKHMVGHSAFHVSHLENDPVLELQILPESPYYTGEDMEYIPILVWDIIDGDAVVVHPPT